MRAGSLTMRNNYKTVSIKLGFTAVFICIICCVLYAQGTAEEAKLRKTVLNLPVTKRQFNDDTSKLQFAIVSDLWGGRRPRIFEDAVEKIGLLQPQFVISVGDLIDGKTYDSVEINKQWDEFDRDIKPLGMPFFYVPGNHDIGNLQMEAAWKKRLGSPYYHFVYKNVLFMCINTEDGGKGGIREKQIEYFKQVLSENKKVRWTFLFMHRPVWQGKDDKQEGYEHIEDLLKDRKYTLFSGHHHTYLSANKNGNKHYVLGSTGGGSDLRGEKYGEFDHVTMVTLTDGEPKVVHLKLDGIIRENIVNEKSHVVTQTLINQTWLLPVPYVSEKQIEKKVTTEILLKNVTDYPLKVSGELSDSAGISMMPRVVNMVVAPHSEIRKQVDISMSNGQEIDLANLSSVTISLTGEIVFNNVVYSLPASKEMLLSWKRTVPILVKAKESAEGYFHGIDTSAMISVAKPEYIKGPWYWSGASDGFVRFKMLKDNRYLYVIALVNDDQWVYGKEDAADFLNLHLEDIHGNKNEIRILPNDNKLKVGGQGTILTEDFKLKRYFSKDMFMAELQIPLKKVLRNDGTVRMNIGFSDYDVLPEKQSSFLYWKPVWGTEGDYKNSGTFLIK